MNVRLLAAALAAACICVPAAQAAPAMVADDEPMPALHYLSEEAASPEHLTPPRPAISSPVMKAQMVRLREVVAAATPEQVARAKADGENETPSAFDDATGLALEKLPATSRLLMAIADETEAVVERGKRHFAEPRPYQVDPAIPHCGKGAKSLKSYPSGHAGFAYSTGWALARLMPDRATPILQRADDYAFGREVCGVHFHIDTEASRVIGTVVAERMLADPRLAETVREARRELLNRP